MLNRRLFITGTVGLVTTTPAATLAAPPIMPRFTQSWNQPLFRQLQGDTVLLKDHLGQVFETRLRTVEDMGSTTELEQFAVSFTSFEPLLEGLYQLSHRTAGCCELYLSTSPQSCTALFSLLRSA